MTEMATVKKANIISLSSKIKKLSFSFIGGVVKEGGIREEAVQYTEAHIENGAGKAIEVGISVTKGVWGKLNFEFEMEYMSDKSFEEYTHEVVDTFTSSQKEYINRNVDSSKQHATWTTWSLGFLSWDHSSGSSETESAHLLENTEKDLKVEQGSKVSDAIEKLRTSETEYGKISGSIEVTGINPYIPTTAYIYIRIVSITFSDGTTKYVIDETPVGGDDEANPVPSKNGQMHKTKIPKK